MKTEKKLKRNSSGLTKDEKLEAELVDIFNEIGKKSGAEIASIAKKLHPNALFIYPLYRGAMVVLPQTDEEYDRGKVTMILYHDPEWMGEDITVENLPKYSDRLEIWGQRSGADLTLNRLKLTPMTEEEQRKFYDEQWKNPEK